MCVKLNLQFEFARDICIIKFADSNLQKEICKDNFAKKIYNDKFAKLNEQSLILQKEM